VAQHKAAKKSVRTSEKARMRNRSWKSKIKTARRKLEAALEGQESENLDALYRDYTSVIDRAVSKGVIHRNNASRKKTRMAHALSGADVSAAVSKKDSQAKTPEESEEPASAASD
jgi:small subunit ribosomal protein S20